MDLARAANFNVVNRLLATINQEASQAASCNLQSNQVHLEDTFRDLLNCLYGLKLVNANSINKNYPGIDLIDEASRICVQVTADISAKKVKETLEKPVMASLSKRGFTLKFCYIGEQNKNVKRRQPKNPHNIKFDTRSGSILTADILSRFNHLDLNSQEEIIALLRRETNEGYVINTDIMRTKLDNAIRQLGPRYTPEANVKTPDMKRLSALADDQLYRKDLLSKAQMAASDIDHLTHLDVEGHDKSLLNEAIEFFSPLTDIVASIPNDNTSRAEFEDWALRLNTAASSCSQYPISWYGGSRPKGELTTSIDDALYRAQTINSACRSWGVEFLTNRRVLICGEAGIGKSHLLADLCERELNKGNAAILVLGSQFNRSDSSVESIPNILGLPGSLDNLLTEIQRYAEAREGVATLAIDALNEGAGRAIWRTDLFSLLEKVSRYPSIRLVLSVRTTYKSEVLPDSLSSGELEIMECEGFGSISSVALKTLCDYYGIAYPTVPLIGMEFSNPLYLKLLCKYISDRGGAFTSNVNLGDLVTAFLTDINNKLADSQRIGYDRNVPLVTWAAKAIVRSNRFSYGSIDYESAVVAVVNTLRDYVALPGSFLEGLVSEGLFNVVEGWECKHLAFSYELIGNYLVALTAVEMSKEPQQIRKFGSCAISLSHHLDTDYEWISSDQGVLAALSTICPAECECELFELVHDRNCASVSVAEAFVEGLPWRKNSKMTPELDRFIRDVVIANDYPRRSFFTMSFQLAARHGGIDATYYRDLLLPMPMPDRDHVWSSAVARSTKAASFVDWVWEHGSEIDEWYAENIATMLALCFAATNVVLRRKAIKALTLVLINRPHIAGQLWEAFHNIDDDYVLEGICGAIYGSAINSNEFDSWTTVTKNISSVMLDDSNAYPNAVIRDYVTLLNDAIIGPHPNMKSPASPFSSPWKSEWYDSLPRNEEIDAILETYSGEYGEHSNEASAVWWIIHSMTTEYGRGTCAYGDFGRYTLGHRVSRWVNQFESDQLLSNALIQQILTKWYKPNLHADYDMEVKRFQSRGLYEGCERIGKKYQKIALNRLLARLADNFPPYDIERIYQNDAEEHTKSNVDLCETLASSGNYLDFSEAIVNNSDLIIGERRRPLNVWEVGSELLSLRSHDPSFPWKWSTLASPYELAEAYPSFIAINKNPDDWCRSDDEVEILNEFRIRHLNGRRFYTLAAYIKWQASRDDKRCRESIWISGALLVSRDDKDTVLKHYSDRSASLAFSDMRFGELFGGWGFTLLNSLHQSELFELEKKVIEASYLYDWSRDQEELQDESPNVFLPCAALVSYFGLKRRGPLSWKDITGRTVSCCLIDQKTGSRALLFDADLLDVYLNKTGQALIWDDYFEKQTARLIYRKWMNVTPEADHFRMKDTEDPYCGKTAQIHWTKEDGWIDE